MKAIISDIHGNLEALQAVLDDIKKQSIDEGIYCLGDVIGYDWKGRPDGILDHLAIVTSLNQYGYPSVTQHSPSRTRYWSWDPAGNWIQVTHPGSRVYLIHIIM